MLHFYTFGGLRIEDDGQPLQLSTHKARDLLAYLIAFRDRSHPRSVLTGLLWPDLPEDKARRRLSDTLWRIRRVLDDYVSADEEYVWFNTDLPHWLDAEQFQRVASSLRPETLRADPRGKTSNLRAVEDALALYQALSSTASTTTGSSWNGNGCEASICRRWDTSSNSISRSAITQQL